MSDETRAHAPHARPRQRLSPDQRVPQILDAALAEFSRRGFTATRMDDIARACGLSKGGLYAHFDSKETIFKALLERALRGADLDEGPRPAADAEPRAVAEWIVDRLHAALLAPGSVATLRLLISERERVPLRVDEWRQSLVHLRTEAVARLLGERLCARGQPDSVLARHPWLALSPVIHVLMWQAVFGEDGAPDPGFRQAHVDLLAELLR